MKNTKAFTLIELLAVIVILGIVIAIAIPGVNLIVSNARKNTFISSGKLFAEAGRNKLLSQEIVEPTNPERVTVVSLSMLDLDKKEKSPYQSNWDYTKTYILIHNKGTSDVPSYQYYFAGVDEAGNGFELTKVESLTKKT